MVKAITNGYDYNYFKRITVTATSFQSDSDVVFNINAPLCSFSLVNEGNVTVTYSFNGSTIHGDLIVGTPTQAIFFDNRSVSAIWFSVPSGSANVRVEGWATK